jgi:hypothetical protein
LLSKTCPHCKRTRKVRKASSKCPCGYRPVTFWVRLSRAISGVTGKPYKARIKPVPYKLEPKEAQIER